jgi:uncharacterized protein
MPPVRLRVRAQPGASRSEVVGWQGDTLRVRVQAPPLEGRANAAVIELLAKALGVPRRSVRLERGETSREKVIAVDDLDEAEIRRRLGWPSV